MEAGGDVDADADGRNRKGWLTMEQGIGTGYMDYKKSLEGTVGEQPHDLPLA